MVTPRALYLRLPSLPRRSRRAAVIAAFSGYPLLQIGYAQLRATNVISVTVWAPIAIGLFLATLIGMVAVYGFSSGRMDRKQHLDERQRQMIDRALVVSYGVVTTVVALVAGALALRLTFGGPMTLGMEDLVPWLLAIGLYEPFLPFAALAWIEPDAPADDEA
jgi:hypothetical protein